MAKTANDTTNGSNASKDFDSIWDVDGLITQPQSSRLTSILAHSKDFQSLATDYMAALPIALKSIITNSAVDLELFAPPSFTVEGKSNLVNKDAIVTDMSLPIWGKVYNPDISHGNKLGSHVGNGIGKKGVLLRRDLLYGDSTNNRRGRCVLQLRHILNEISIFFVYRKRWQEDHL